MMTTQARTTAACTSTSSSDARPNGRGATGLSPSATKVSSRFWTRLKSLALTSITPGVTGRKEQPGD